MPNPTRASRELFRRTPDECYPSLSVLNQHCVWQKKESLEFWIPPKSLGTRTIDTDRLMLTASNDQTFEMNDWSFGQSRRSRTTSVLSLWSPPRWRSGNRGGFFVFRASRRPACVNPLRG